VRPWAAAGIQTPPRAPVRSVMLAVREDPQSLDPGTSASSVQQATGPVHMMLMHTIRHELQVVSVWTHVNGRSGVNHRTGWHIPSVRGRECR
jgi:hypothetical protein